MITKLDGGVLVIKLPFKIKSKKGAKLTDQVVTGLRHAIRSGTFRTGDLLPTCKKMATQAGVSEIIIRHAVKRLADEGLLRVRTYPGTTVSSVRGHVLYLTWHDPTMYYHSALSSVVTERLRASSVLLRVTHISYEEAKKGFPDVQTDLARAISLAVVEGIANGVDELLESKGIPFIHFAAGRPSPLATRAVLMRHALVFPEIRDHCLACGVRNMLLMGIVPNDERDTQLAKLLADAGVRCHMTALPPTAVPGTAEFNERQALTAMEAWLKRERQLPDLIWFSDDFVAQGALTAMANRGIRIPEDVQVISWANAGLGPVFIKPLTRVEMDPTQHGEAIATCVLEQLEGKRSGGKPVILSPVFIEGATTVKKVKLRTREAGIPRGTTHRV
jgi:DNA-binding LacI/PurR family transcriptional regulator